MTRKRFFDKGIIFPNIDSTQQIFQNSDENPTSEEQEKT
jgi:hypothetical protein